MAVKDKPKDIQSLSTLKLKESLEQKQLQFANLDDIFGATLLTNPGYMSASRSIMFTSHLRQALTLNEPDFPAVMTNYENIVGKNSTGYYKAKTNFEVIDRICKYSNGTDDGHMYLMFLYDKEKDHYEVIQKRIVEDLTEKFGFSFNNKVLDSKSVGDNIKKGEVLYKTTSYDDDMNYQYGKNVKFVYMLENSTIEDAIVVSRSLANSMTSKEVETVKISLNDNDILCNVYGDNENYKGFPDIGEFIDGRVVCAKRRIHNSQLLYDLKSSNLRRINYSSDTLAFCEGRIVDIHIFCNKPLHAIEKNRFNAQLLKYLEMQQSYYRDLYLRCKKIIESGSTYSADISNFYKTAKNYLDDDYKWKEEDGSAFSNMIVEFVIERDIPLDTGFKLSGRFGNKGVISEIRDDELMPVLETGERIHIIMNSLTVINRLNSQQLFEQSITFICNRVRERMATMVDINHQIELLLRTVWYFNKMQHEELSKYIKGLSKKSKQSFIQKTIEDRIYIHNPPLWEEEAMFDTLFKLYDEYKWIKPYDVYVERFGRTIKIMKPLIVGDMYMLKLKQTSKKGFSARSTGGISKKGLPEKTNKAKNHQELFSKTPIRAGDQENINSAIGVSSKVMADLHMFYRSSVLGRRDLGEKLMTSLKELKDFKHDKKFTNRNIEILNAYLLFMGLKIEFSGQMLEVKIATDVIKEYKYDNRLYMCTEEEFENIKIELDIRAKYANDVLLCGPIDEIERSIRVEVSKAQLEGKMYNIVL